MDDIVVRGMAKWPNVPAVYGWLSLDRRGGWRIKGDPIANPGVCEFIGRNYERDAQGRWFFQNGPQRVFVSLDYTPFVYRIVSVGSNALTLQCHTGRPVTAISGAWLDENGVLLLETERGPGLVHDRDLDQLLPHLVDASGNAPDESVLYTLMEALQQQKPAALWLKFREMNIRIEPVRSGSVPERFGFVARPVQPAGQEECY
jgi:hypothetical protein